MDNSNNNNSTSNPFPPIAPLSGANPPPPPPHNPSYDPNATWQPTTPPPSSAPTWDPNPNPLTSPIPTPPQEGQAPLTPTYTPPAPTPVDVNPPPQFPSSTPSTVYPSLGDQPTSDATQTYGAPQASPQDNSWNPQPQSSAPITSPLDNPWGAPSQPPPLDGSTPSPNPTEEMSTYPPSPMSSPEATTPLPWSPQPQTSQPSEEVAPTTSEPAPTDLSHLINNTETVPPANGGAETLVAPTNGGVPDVPTLPTEDHKRFPKWIIGVAVGLLIIVAGASAYFILGIGQNSQTTSIPAETAPVSQEVRPPAPIPTPVSQPVPDATGSANFGELQGGSQQATSAGDIIRQRQQGQ